MANKSTSTRFNCKFMHFRRIDAEGNVAARSGATVAYIHNEDGTTNFALAVCHPNDNYNKELGRIKASARLTSERLSDVYTGEQAFADAIASEMMYDYGYERKFKG